MTKTKLLFLLRDYEHGGIPRVLANLLERIDSSQVDADLFVCNPCGIFQGRMPNCRVLPSNIWLRLFSCNYRKEHGFFKILAVLAKFFRHACMRFFHRDILLNWAERSVAKSFGNRYDVMWVCSEDIPARLAEYSGSAARKMIWIHNNYDVLYPEVEKGGFPNFLLYDKIVCVADFAVEALVRNLKEKRSINLSNRTVLLYNILNDTDIRKQGSLPLDDPSFQTDEFTIVSVGRLAYQKQFEVIPSMASILKKAGRSFRWYIIGGGAPVMWKWIQDEIYKYDVDEEVILLGVKSNPYAYIARADLMVVPSRYETYPTVINEAKALGTPVIANNFTGVEEILFEKDGWYGPLSQMPEKLLSVVGAKLTPEERATRCVDFTEHNARVMAEFYRIIEG